MLRKHPWLFAILLVAPDGSGPYPTIQSAIDAAVHGDEVHLTPGTFRGEGNHSLNMLGKDLRLTSQQNDPATVTIETDSAYIAVDLSGDSVLEAITFTAPRNYAKQNELWAPCVVAGGQTIRRCVFEGIRGGCAISTLGRPLIQECRFANNLGPFVIESIQGGLTLSGCTFENNYSPPQVQSVGLHYGLIEYCTFAQSSLAIGEWVTIRNCTIETLRVGTSESAGDGVDCPKLFDTVVTNPIEVDPWACYRIITTRPAEEDEPLAIAPESWWAPNDGVKTASWGTIKASYR